MTTEEFSNEFDTLLDSYSKMYGKSPITIELDEYEKSVFLTKAQEDIIIELYSGKNPLNESFENTEELRQYLRILITEGRVGKHLLAELSEDDFKLCDSNYISYAGTFEPDILFIIWETAYLNKDKIPCNKDVVKVIPVTHDDLHNILSNPFKGPNDKRVIRVDAGRLEASTMSQFNLISKYPIEKYNYKFVKKPTPIILTDLPSHLSINGKNTKMECELDSSIHRPILDRAVKLAMQSKALNLSNQNTTK